MDLKDEGTRISWSGTSGVHDHLQTEFHLQKTWQRVAARFRINNNIMVVNMGLHWLHFYNMARSTSAEAIQRWIHYEEWLQEVYDKARRNNVQVPLYKTTNYVCDEKLYGHFLDAHRLSMAEDPETIANCCQTIGRFFVDETTNTSTLEPHDILNYCYNGTINHKGADYLNARLEAFVASLDVQEGMVVEIFRDHDIQSCAYCRSNDGLHYHNQNLLMRARLLANMVQCAYWDLTAS